MCLDDVTTPAGRSAGQLGGSAVYAALAASRYTRVHLCGVVGRDGEHVVREALEGGAVGLAGLDVVAAPTRRWTAVHDFERWVTAAECSAEGATASWRPQLGAEAAAAPVLFCGSMAPEQQLAVLAQSRARLVGSDSMTVHIAADSARVWRVVEGSDVLFLNRAELAALTDTAESGWAGAARALLGRGRLRAVVVKAGPLGAACVTAGGVVERAAHPVARIVDPTGAGDSLAGAFLGTCAAAECDDDAVVVAALEAGVRCAAHAIAAFGVAGLLAGG